jgi:hypothetical protein
MSSHTPSKWGCDIKHSLYNLNKTRTILDLFCWAFEARINWGKFTTIWANKNKKDWEWGQEVGLKWIPKGKRVRYLASPWKPILTNSWFP